MLNSLIGFKDESNQKSLQNINPFLEEYCISEKMEVEEMSYPQMKMIDMGFWQVVFDLDESKGIKTAHREKRMDSFSEKSLIISAFPSCLSNVKPGRYLYLEILIQYTIMNDLQKNSF